MKYLIYSILFFSFLAQGQDLPEGMDEKSDQATLAEPTPPAHAEGISAAAEVSAQVEGSVALPSEDNPAPALPPSDTPSIATNTQVSTDTNAEAPPVDPAEVHAVISGESTVPVDATAELPAPPPVAVEAVDYGPSAEEGYGSVGLKNDGGILEVGRDADVTPKDVIEAEGDRKTSSAPSGQPSAQAQSGEQAGPVEDSAEAPKSDEHETLPSLSSEPSDNAFLPENSL